MREKKVSELNYRRKTGANVRTNHVYGKYPLNTYGTGTPTGTGFWIGTGFGTGMYLA